MIFSELSDNEVFFIASVQLLGEEYSHLSPTTLESLGFGTGAGGQEQTGLSDSQKKLVGKAHNDIVI